ncbi:hypothetical protein HDU93_009899 [Gonapodya sp. JEL0774]|nr:hypothetical protein HDU93_009899 [Gonapodya sp. JEL0774]
MIGSTMDGTTADLYLGAAISMAKALSMDMLSITVLLESGLSAVQAEEKLRTLETIWSLDNYFASRLRRTSIFSLNPELIPRSVVNSIWNPFLGTPTEFDWSLHEIASLLGKIGNMDSKVAQLSRTGGGGATRTPVTAVKSESEVRFAITIAKEKIRRDFEHFRDSECIMLLYTALLADSISKAHPDEFPAFPPLPDGANVVLANGMLGVAETEHGSARETNASFYEYAGPGICSRLAFHAKMGSVLPITDIHMRVDNALEAVRLVHRCVAVCARVNYEWVDLGFPLVSYATYYCALELLDMHVTYDAVPNFDSKMELIIYALQGFGKRWSCSAKLANALTQSFAASKGWKSEGLLNSILLRVEARARSPLFSNTIL